MKFYFKSCGCYLRNFEQFMVFMFIIVRIPAKRTMLTELTERYPRYGFKKLFQILCRQGNARNHKRVHRIYCVLKLSFRRKGKHRLPVRNPVPLAMPEALNKSWSIDFMHDVLVCGRRFRTFNVVDDLNREALAIETDLNIPAQRMVRVLDRIVANR